MTAGGELLNGTTTLADAARKCWDVVVVGAGPAGSALARQVALAGASVLLVDRARFPRGKVCGSCLNGYAQHALAEMGLGDLPGRLGAVPLERFSLYTRGCPATLRLPHSVALSREAFDAALAGEAVQAGAAFLPQTKAQLECDSGGLRQVSLGQVAAKATAAARVVVAADGLGRHSLAHRSEFTLSVAPASRIGLGTVLNDDSAPYAAGQIYMAAAPSGYVGIVRLEDGRLDVAAAIDAAELAQGRRPAGAVSKVVEAAGLEVPASLKDATFQGTIKLTRRSWPLAAEGVFVIGDAAGYVEPFTGEGMAWALASAVLVAPLVGEATRAWRPELGDCWQQLYRRHIGRRQTLCLWVARGLRRPWALGAASRLLGMWPSLAQPAMAAMNGHSLVRA